MDRAADGRGAPAGPASRIVLLDFDPAAGFWDSADGISLVTQSAGYARQGVTAFSPRDAVLHA